jgi:hypothetical protein
MDTWSNKTKKTKIVGGKIFSSQNLMQQNLTHLR